MKHDATVIPIYAICEVCGEADEQASMVEGMCPNCIGVVRYVMEEDRRRNRGVDRFDAITAVVIGFWTAVIVWRLFR